MSLVQDILIDGLGNSVLLYWLKFNVCFSRSSKGYMAQLMRIYIVTPEGPLRVSVNPLIQPAPHPCPTFHPGVGQEIDLSAGSLWVLRLPYPL